MEVFLAFEKVQYLFGSYASTLKTNLNTSSQNSYTKIKGYINSKEDNDK